MLVEVAYTQPISSRLEQGMNCTSKEWLMQARACILTHNQKMSQVYDRIGPLREEAHAWYEYLLKAFKTGAPLNDDIAD